MTAVQLTDLFTDAQLQQLTEVLQGLAKFNPDSELLKVLAPAQVQKIIRAVHDIRQGGGYGSITIEFAGGKYKHTKVTRSIE